MTSHDEKRNQDFKEGDPSHSEDLEDIIRNTTVTGEISEYAVVAEGEERTTWFIWILVTCSSISGLLFGESLPRPIENPTNFVQGYDTGVISGALVSIGSDLGPAALSNGQKVRSIQPPSYIRLTSVDRNSSLPRRHLVRC